MWSLLCSTLTASPHLAYLLQLLCWQVKGWHTAASGTTGVQHAFVFELHGDSWERSVLWDPEEPSSDPQHLFGASVAVHEGPPALAAVGKAGFGSLSANQYTTGGRVFIYCGGCGLQELPPEPSLATAASARWRHIATIVEPAASAAPGNAFGTSVAFSTDG